MSAREAVVAQLVADGLSNRQIASRLVISERTAQSHVQHILTKLGLGNRTQIAAWVHAEQRAAEPAVAAVSLLGARLERNAPASSSDRWRVEIAEVATSHGGTVLRIDEAGLVCVFATTTGALRAALQIQLRARDADGPRRPTECIAVHRGALCHAPLGLVGVALHQVVRMTNAGHPGQILVSDAVAADAELPDGAGFHGLGTFELRGVGRMAIHEVVHPLLPRCTRPLETRAGTHHELPRTDTSFVGRGEEISALSDLVNRHSLVTVVGPGGGGKTRLALEVARTGLVASADGAVFVDLSELPPGADVLAPLNSALGTNESAERLAAILADTDLLVVFDNCEHVLDPAARLITTILGRCPEVRVLATSRQSLGLAGEVRFALSSLAWPSASTPWHEFVATPAVTLLRDRARLHNRDFQLNERDLPALAEFMSLVEGHPLAIELAAGRLRMMSLTRICAELSDGLAVLAGPGRDAPARHRTLHQTVEWSYRTLEDRERRLLGRLACFSGSADLDALRAVSGVELTEDETVTVVGSLIDKSLVTVIELDGGARYRLHPLIREFVLDAWPATDREVFRDDHARWFARLAAALGDGPLPGGDRQWIAQHESERANFQVAIAHLADRDIDLALRVLIDSEIGVGFTARNECDWWDDRLQQYEARSSAASADQRARSLAQVLFKHAETRDPRGDAVHDAVVDLLERGLGRPARCAALAAKARWKNKAIGARPDLHAVELAVTAADDAGGTYWPFSVRYLLAMDLPRTPALGLCREAQAIARRHRLHLFERLAHASIAVSEQFGQTGEAALIEWRRLFTEGATIRDIAPTDACFYVLAEAEHGPIGTALPLAEYVAMELTERATGALGNEVNTVLARARMIAGDHLGAESALRRAARSAEPLWDFLGGLHVLLRSAVERRHGRPLDGLHELGRLVDDVAYEGVTDLGARTIEELAEIASAVGKHDVSADLLATAFELRTRRDQPLSPAGQRAITELTASLATRSGRPLPLDLIPVVAADLAR